MARLTIPIKFDEEKLRQLVNEAVERLKAEGYIWKDNPQPLPEPPAPSYIGGNLDGKQLLG